MRTFWSSSLLQKDDRDGCVPLIFFMKFLSLFLFSNRWLTRRFDEMRFF